MKILLTSSFISLILSGCAIGSGVSCASAFSSYSYEAHHLSRQGERELINRLQHEIELDLMDYSYEGEVCQ